MASIGMAGQSAGSFGSFVVGAGVSLEGNWSVSAFREALTSIQTQQGHPAYNGLVREAVLYYTQMAPATDSECFTEKVVELIGTVSDERVHDSCLYFLAERVNFLVVHRGECTAPASLDDDAFLSKIKDPERGRKAKAALITLQSLLDPEQHAAIRPEVAKYFETGVGQYSFKPRFVNGYEASTQAKPNVRMGAYTTLAGAKPGSNGPIMKLDIHALATTLVSIDDPIFSTQQGVIFYALTAAMITHQRIPEWIEATFQFTSARNQNYALWALFAEASRLDAMDDLITAIDLVPPGTVSKAELKERMISALFANRELQGAKEIVTVTLEKLHKQLRFSALSDRLKDLLPIKKIRTNTWLESSDGQIWQGCAEALITCDRYLELRDFIVGPLNHAKQAWAATLEAASARDKLSVLLDAAKEYPGQIDTIIGYFVNKNCTDQLTHAIDMCKNNVYQEQLRNRTQELEIQMAGAKSKRK